MITVIDYDVGNMGSIGNMLESIGQPYTIATSARDISLAQGLLLPGVGAAGVGMDNLKTKGMDESIKEALKRNIPFLGICLGMQLLFQRSEENDTDCLGIIAGTVKRFTMERKVPQIGWNAVAPNNANPYSAKLFTGIPSQSEFYYVNSYYPEPSDPSVSAALSVYGESFTAVVATKKIVATQFHPEKSGKAGLQFIKNFMEVYI